MKKIISKLIFVVVVIISFNSYSKPMYSVASENNEFSFLLAASIGPLAQKSGLLLNSNSNIPYVEQGNKQTKSKIPSQKSGSDYKIGNTMTWIFRLFITVMVVYLLNFGSLLKSERL